MSSSIIKTLFFMLLTIYNISGDTQSKHNVVLILAEDGGLEMGAYRNKTCQAPNLDKLSNSLNFNSAFTKNGLHQGVHHFNSFDSIKSLPKILHKLGYRTGIIGKNHVGRKSVYQFDYQQTEENNSILQIGRNITHIKLLAREFLQNKSKDPFFLYIGFQDSHRCRHTNSKFGLFCEKFGNGETGMGTIPDWNPVNYQWNQIQLPYFIPDTEIDRREIAAQCTAISRLDQGVGLILNELKNAGKLDSTLIIYRSDNGIPFPNGRTKYDSGMAEPILSLEKRHRRNQVTNSLSNSLDITPTNLDWFKINKESKQILTGSSLPPVLPIVFKVNYSNYWSMWADWWTTVSHKDYSYTYLVVDVFKYAGTFAAFVEKYPSVTIETNGKAISESTCGDIGKGKFGTLNFDTNTFSKYENKTNFMYRVHFYEGSYAYNISVKIGLGFKKVFGLLYLNPFIDGSLYSAGAYTRSLDFGLSVSTITFNPK